MTNWEDKIKAFLNYPPTKALNTKGHKEVSKKFLDEWHISSGGDEMYDQISASVDRPGVPGAKERCSVDFKESPEITHPISEGRLHLDLSALNISSIEDNAIKMLSKMALNENNIDKSKFFTLFEGLKQKLSRDEPSLYSIWNKIPADTRIPDHSIWHHNSLVSALSSCKGEPYFFVFSLGPVQGFISEARKLRDLWVGSVMLSYLSWVGMRVICDKFGPDHIIYPSLSGQPLFYDWLEEINLTEVLDTQDKETRRIASLPNKFVAVIPGSSIVEISSGIKNAIVDDWDKISNSVYDSVKLQAGANPEYFEKIWNRQNRNLWEFYWSASPWIESFQDSFLKEITTQDLKRLKELSELFEKSSSYSMNQGILYKPSHKLAQTIQAASKNARQFHESYCEPGDKCTQCGKRQALSIAEERNATKLFWKKIAEDSEQEIKNNERLCSICLIKRFIYKKPNLLPSQLKDIVKKSKFPSSTEMAFNPIKRKITSIGKIEIWEDFVRLCGGDEKAYNELHNNDEMSSPDSRVNDFLKRLENEAHIKVTNIFGKYYAILMMDGDKMGDLVNGKSDNLAKWHNIMHSSLPKKMEESPAKDQTKGWLENNRLEEKRHLTPAVHKAISEALGDFSLNTVPYVINKYYGRLIYAGGDDVLAVMPVDTVLKAAQEIMELYRMPFLIKKIDGSIKECRKSYKPIKGEKLLIHPGGASTISASIVIAHHKEPLRRLIVDAHNFLDFEAKEKAGRDAIAISLRKRSGVEMIIAGKWSSDNDKFIDKLCHVTDSLSDNKNSSKLMYKIKESKTALETLKLKNLEGAVEKFIESLIEKGERDKDKNDEEFRKEKVKRATQIAAIMEFDGDNKLNTDGLIIARFLAQCIGE